MPEDYYSKFQSETFPDMVPALTKLVATAYTAGLLDGEGCLMCYQKVRDNMIWGSFEVTITNTHKNVLMDVQRHYGFGRITTTKKHGHLQDVHVFRIFNKKEITAFLEDVLPFLKVKRKQADILLQTINRSSDRDFVKQSSLLLKQLKRGYYYGE